MKDIIVRGTAADHQLRIFAVSLRDTAEAARQIHGTCPAASAALGRVLAAAAMMGSMMKSKKDLLTLQIKGDGPIGGLTVTADSAGHVKGYVDQPVFEITARADGKLNVGGAVGHGTLRVIRDLGLKEPYVGQVELMSGEIGDDIAYYYASSEQVPTAVGLGVYLTKDNHIQSAGGFMIQVMPFADEAVINTLEERLQSMGSVTDVLNDGAAPEELVARLLEGYDLQWTERAEVEYHCGCSRERMEKALISLGSQELETLRQEDEPVEMVCHFCHRKQVFSDEELDRLIHECRK
ncbi:MAG: Hsp33 family molecular chaperone HslO [Lachnospiraceae bacterium]|nr:Hsp33 family molecular chaperone HslO [Lachnospiraceae bacterium]MDY5741965.1 Hsp33 family molecular chaperone HslO [Lachnospiraceae bacterium]